MERITSLHNPRIKQAAKLRDRRARRQQARFAIYGARELRRALEAGVRPMEAFVCPELCACEDARVAIELLHAAHCPLFEVTLAVFEKLNYGERIDGVVAVAPEQQRGLEAIRLPPLPLVAVLEGVEKPGNVGAVLRSADAAGVSALVLADGGTDLFNPNTIRASLGTVFTLPAAWATSRETLSWLRQNQLTIFAARVDGALDYTAVDWAQPAAIVLGGEAEGLSETWRGSEITSIRLPMRGRADSLNVSVTAAVLFFEALRQREQRGPT